MSETTLPAQTYRYIKQTVLGQDKASGTAFFAVGARE